MAKYREILRLSNHGLSQMRCPQENGQSRACQLDTNLPLKLHGLSTNLPCYPRNYADFRGFH